MEGGGEVSGTLFAFILVLACLPLVLWVAFNRWRIWARQLSRQLASLADGVEELNRRSLESSETIEELEAYLEQATRIAAEQCRSARLLTVSQASAMGTLIDVTRGLRRALRESKDPEARVRNVLATRRGTIAAAFDRLAGQ